MCTTNRYVTFTSGSLPGRSEAIRVTFTNLWPPHDHANGRTAWVGEPFPVSEVSGSGGLAPAPTFWAARLQCDPFYTDWTTYDCVSAHDPGILPSATYAIEVIDQGCPLDETNFSTPMTVNTSAFGDVNGDNCEASADCYADFDDINCVLDKFLNYPAAPAKARADLGPDVPDMTVDFVDIVYTVDAFLEDPPVFAGPSVDPCGTGGGSCGNGTVEFPEQCDDGNSDDTDACLNNCRNATCGDGYLWAGVERCDDGNAVNGDGCDRSCVLETCGNGAQDSGEQCDDAGESPGCDADCTFVLCGDRMVNETAGEECDDGNGAPGDGCDSGCQVEGTATVRLLPISSTGPHTIDGNEITLQEPGQRVWLEIYIYDWDHDHDGDPLLRTWQAEIDAAGYTSGLAGYLTPASEACTIDADCLAAFGTGAVCNDPGFPPGGCTPAFIDADRLDYLFSGMISVSVVDVYTLGHRFGAIGLISGRFDAGAARYAGTLILDVPEEAAGTFTVGFKRETTYLVDLDKERIPLGELVPARITVPASLACCMPGGECENSEADTCAALGGIPRSEVCLGDVNENGIDDACEPLVPTVSEWGLLAMTLLTLTAGTVVLMRRRPVAV